MRFLDLNTIVNCKNLSQSQILLSPAKISIAMVDPNQDQLQKGFLFWFLGKVTGCRLLMSINN